MIPEELHTIEEIKALPVGTTFFDPYQDIYWEVDGNPDGTTTCVFETNAHCVDCGITFTYDNKKKTIWVEPGEDPKRPWIKKEIEVSFEEYFTMDERTLTVKTVPYSAYKELLK